MDHVQAVVQILTEAAFSNKCQKLDIRRRDDPNIDLQLLRAAQSHEFTFLNYAKQFCLRLRADGGDFVEENRALIGNFEQTLLGRNRAGERALHVAEQLRFQQIDRNGARIYRNKRFVGARGSGMNRFRDQFLARAALAADQHRRTRRADLRHKIEERQHLFALADNVRETRALLERPLQLNVLFAELPRFHGLRHLRKQLIV